MADNEEEVVENNNKNNNKNDKQPFTLDSVLSQIEGEQTKKAKDQLKGKLGDLISKRKEALKAVKVLDKQIEEEWAKFQEGLA